ncbi:MAG: M20/M25/M40 family metallo-hydrolase [Vicinamibacterales bacterium]
MTPNRAGLFGLVMALTLAGIFASAQGQDQADLAAVSVIKEEALQRSQLMDVLSYLTDVYGPRVTGSPNIKNAANYAVVKMHEWGISSAGLEPWGPFGKGWSNERFSAHVIQPQPYPLIGYPKAYTPGTDGPVTGEAVLAPIASERDLDIWRGKLRGKFVLMTAPGTVAASLEPLGRRYTDRELESLAKQPAGRAAGAGRGGGATGQSFARRRLQFFVDEGVAGVLEPSRGNGSAVFVLGGDIRQSPDTPVPVQVVLSVEHYGRIARTLQKQIPVTLELDIRNRFHKEDLNSFTIVGGIPGTDKASEFVMVGAHFDSWHTGTGATDNAAGAAVMLEVMRILKATGLKMRRTVRIALWTGEEQGLLGSGAYVKEHFADRRTMQLRPDHSRLSAYYNLDNGTGAIRGIYLEGNEALVPIFQKWMAPFANVGMKTLAIRGTRGTDHTSFDAVGLPGFQFIQDPIEYSTRTHHSNLDLFERIQASDLIQNAAIVASFVYHTANSDDLLPRKPLPPAQPPASSR